MEDRISLVTEIEVLGIACKNLENSCPKVLCPSKWTILRVDGHKFSTFTKGFQDKKSPLMINAMNLAAADWLKEFSGVCCYVQSDEATLVIPPVDSKVLGAALMFKGRTNKLITIAASYFSVRFNRYLPAEFQHVAHFDCRAFQVGSVENLLEVIRWRQLDGFRNGVSVCARILKMKDQRASTKDKIEFIKEDSEFADQVRDSYIIHGSFIKKELVTVNDVQRTKVRTVCLGKDFIIVTPTIDWITSKYLTSE